MMDYYSQYPAPSIEQCQLEIKNLIKNGFKGNAPCTKMLRELDDVGVDELISEAFIHSGILDENDNVKFSLSGWMVWGQADIVDSMGEILWARRKDKLRRKVRGLLRSSFALISAYNNTVERLYHPDSEFVSHVLKSEFESACADNS